MKHLIKYISFILLLSMFVSVLSCANSTLRLPIINKDFEYKENEDTPCIYNAIDGMGDLKYYDNAVYFFNGHSSVGRRNYSTLNRYNVETGNLTSVCADPLCQHDTEDCPFYGISPICFVHDNKIYYRRSYYLYDYDNNKYTGYFSDFVLYDMHNSKLKQLIVYPYDDPVPLYSRELYVEHYRFYYDYIYDEKIKAQYFSVCRMDLNDGSIVILQKDNSFNSDAVTTMSFDNMFLFSINNKIYFTDGQSIYYTDFDMNNRQNVMNGAFIFSDIYTDGKYIYWGECETPGNVNIQILYRARLDGSEKTSLNIETENWYLTQKFIYYLNSHETVIGKNKLSGRSGDEIVLRSNEIRRAAHDGSSNEAVFELIQDDINLEIYSYICVGNYIYAAYHTYTDKNNDGAYDDSEYYQSTDKENYTILRIDVTDGETYYIHCGTEDN